MIAEVKKVLFVSLLTLSALTEISGMNHRHRRHDEESERNNNEERGFFDFFLRNPPPRPATQTALVRPPNIYRPSASNAPAAPVINFSMETQRPAGIFRPFMGAAVSSHESSANYINMDWVKYSLHKCAKINPLQITVILPTNANSLVAPKMYYFENSTAMAKSWYDAQSWCTARGMDLVTVNDENENKVLKDKMKQIFAGSTVNTDNDGSNAFWIGLNNLDGVAPFTYIGDSTGTRLDWHTGEPSIGAGELCGAYSQRNTADLILMDAKVCSGAGGTYRYICEVSDECAALFMSRYRTPVSHHHHHRPLGGK